MPDSRDALGACMCDLVKMLGYASALCRLRKLLQVVTPDVCGVPKWQSSSSYVCGCQAASPDAA